MRWVRYRQCHYHNRILDQGSIRLQLQKPLASLVRIIRFLHIARKFRWFAGRQTIRWDTLCICMSPVRNVNLIPVGSMPRTTTKTGAVSQAKTYLVAMPIWHVLSRMNAVSLHGHNLKQVREVREKRHPSSILSLLLTGELVVTGCDLSSSRSGWTHPFFS